MFAYCNNNPANYLDKTGTIAARFKIQPLSFDQVEVVKSDSSSQSNNPKDSPPDHPDFVPPRKGTTKKRNPNGQGWGWVDNKGNVWVWTPGMHGGPGWTVQYPNGGHGHAYPGGRTRTHLEAQPEQPSIIDLPSYPKSTIPNYLPTVAPIIMLGGIALGVVMITSDINRGKV